MYTSTTGQEQVVGFDPLSIISMLLFIPYLVWGVYLLRIKLGDHHEVKPIVEILTIVGVVLFLAFQLRLMRAWLGPQQLNHIMANIALFISAAAFYGHIIATWLSRLLTDMMMPPGDPGWDEPKYGAAEGAERQGDFERAALEYLTLCQSFPKDVKSALGAADNLLKIGREEDAVIQFERAFELLRVPDQVLRIAFRLVELYTIKMNRTADGIRVLEGFLQRFPNAERREAVEARLERLRAMESMASKNSDQGVNEGSTWSG